MALSAVQSGYAGTAYAYRKTTKTTEGFNSAVSFESYGMDAQYAEESTPDSPMAQATSNYGWEPVKARLEAAENSNGAEDTETIDFMQFIRERMEEIFVLVQNGDTQTSFQIGASSFTIKEWEEFLEKFDALEDAIKELMKEEQEKRAQKAEAAKTLTEEKINALVSESTKCTYPSSVPKQEDTMYITWYTEESIFCQKAGQSEGYEWIIDFESTEEYNKVMEFLNRFDQEDNLRFAAHENFWQDFLSEKLDIEGFMKFFEGTNHGVPNYAISVGDSMYVDKDKIQWAKYMNPPGTKLYTREEMLKMQDDLMEANKAELLN